MELEQGREGMRKKAIQRKNKEKKLKINKEKHIRPPYSKISEKG
jgi:hypothetical protein